MFNKYPIVFYKLQKCPFLHVNITFSTKHYYPVIADPVLLAALLPLHVDFYIFGPIRFQSAMSIASAQSSDSVVLAHDTCRTEPAS